MVEWLRSCLTIQETQVRAVVRENYTRCGALSPHAATSEALFPRAPALQQEEPLTAGRSPRTSVKRSLRLRQLEKAQEQQRRPSPGKNKLINK